MRVGFVLIPGFALTSFSLAKETLSVANNISGETLYECELFGAACGRGDTVISSNDVPLVVRPDLDGLLECDIAVVCAYRDAAEIDDRQLSGCLRKIARQGRVLAALSSASFILARAGLLDGLNCSVVNEHALLFSELYPEIPVLENLYTVSGNLLTCAGGLSALDMMLYIIGTVHGRELARSVGDNFLHDRIRSPEESRNKERYLRLRMKSPVLGLAVELMEANFEEPLSIGEIANRAGATVRSLENAFLQHLGEAPNVHYRAIRLKEAHRLLLESGLPVTVIAQATGFPSPSYFSKRFSEMFGMTPTALRANGGG